MAPAAIHALIIGPAMVRIGELWESGDISVADEHLATAISHGVLIQLFDALTIADGRSRERVLLAAVEGQHHILGLRMVADVLDGAGFDVLFLGADVPVEALGAFVAEHQPPVIGLGFNIAVGVTRLAEAIVAVHLASHEPRIMLGGQAVPPGLRHAVYPFVQSSLDVVLAVERLLRGPPQTVSPALRALLLDGIETGARRRQLGHYDPVAERLAEMVAESSDLSRVYMRETRMFRELALRDPVTGLANRRAFDDRLFEQTHPGGDGSALLMIDVDEFKQVNDVHGHDAGDQLLRLVGEAITHTIRPHDFAARIGGDEFAALLAGTTLETAREIGDRVRQAIAEQAGPPITVSIGIAPLTDDTRAALLAADVALYKAKASGRNRVAAADQTALLE